LESKVRDWAPPEDAPRVTTARASAVLLQQLIRGDGVSIVRDLASFTPRTSLTAMGRNFTTASSNTRLLVEDARWIVLRQVRTLLGDAERRERAKLLLEDLAALLVADEVNAMLADGLADLTRRADELLRATPPPPPPPDEVVVLDLRDELASASAAAAELRRLAERLEVEGRDASRITFHVTAWNRRPV
jgi:hypothetical protein